jgi:hypothetical protein
MDAHAALVSIATKSDSDGGEEINHSISDYSSDSEPPPEPAPLRSKRKKSQNSAH